MFSDDADSSFWDDAPTRRLTRPAGTRSHTREIPVVAVERVRTDPLARRLGALVGMIVLAVPVALALRSGNAEGEALRPATTVASTTDPSTTAAPTVATTVASVPATEPATTPAAPTAAPAPAPTTAKRVATTAPAPACTPTYVVVKGDSWSRIGSKVGVSTGAMLAANNATARTLLLPGMGVCLPAGATQTTVAPPTTAAPTPTTAKPAPATTAPPATTPAPRPTYTKEQIIQLIRDVWPDHLEQHALEIAYRESRYNPYAVNSCCYGVFQINYNAHKGWLPTIGVTSAAQLFDPRVNVYAAYVIYQRSGSWAPWGG